jgi:hypothetical protein
VKTGESANGEQGRTVLSEQPPRSWHGELPEIDGDTKGRHHGYFENEHGEQAVFIYEYETGTGTLPMGDAGWERSFLVTDERAPKVILGEAEALWLKACCAIS